MARPDQAESEWKYVRHGLNQRTQILDAAEALFDDRELESVTMTDIAGAAGITRATLYRYFDNKTAVMWAIYNRQVGKFAEGFVPEIEAASKTTYERLEAYLRFLARRYDENPRLFKFMARFFSTYQEVTVNDKQQYRELHGEGFGSGDTVRMLSRDFHDGSVRDDLDPVETIASIVYIMTGMLFLLPDYRSGLEAKYGVTDERVLDRFIDMALAYVKA